MTSNSIYLLFVSFFLIVNGSIFALDDPNTIVVTCASGELGSSIARKLASENCLILTGRNRDKLEQLQEELISQYPFKYQICILDYTDHSSLINFGKVLDSISISGLVLISPRPHFGSDLFQEESDWMKLFQTTFTGPMEALKKAIPHMKASGKIVIIGGTTSVQIIPEYGPACIVRRMWTACAKALSHQLGPKGIHVNILSPGVVLTHYHVDRISKKADFEQKDYEDQLEKEVAQIPLRRHADPKEIAQAVKFLLSEDSDFITGINLLIDGGATTAY